MSPRQERKSIVSTKNSQDVLSGNSHLTYLQGPRDLDDPQSPSSPSILWAGKRKIRDMFGKTAQVWTCYTKTLEITQKASVASIKELTHTNNLTNGLRHATLTPRWSTPFLKTTLLDGVISKHTSSTCKTLSITENKRERWDEGIEKLGRKQQGGNSPNASQEKEIIEEIMLW